MFRIDVPTIAGSLPSPATPGTEGFFTDGNPSSAVPSTIVSQDWLNMIQEELAAIVAAASITRDKTNNAQVLAALNALFGAGGRTKLSGNTNFYVSPSGSDANPGTSGSPWLTLQHAIDMLLFHYDGNGFSATINAANGTYTSGVIVSQPFVGFRSVNLVGNTGTPSSCIISTTSADCVQVINSAVMSVGGFMVQTTTSGNGLNASQQGYISLGGNMIFGAVAAGNAHIAATFGGEVDLGANYSISGSAPAHWSAQAQGRIAVSSGGIVVTLTGTPAFATAFAAVVDQSYLRASGVSFSGTATGNQYNITQNSVLSTAGGLSSFPGSGNTVNTGGVVS